LQRNKQESTTFFPPQDFYCSILSIVVTTVYRSRWQNNRHNAKWCAKHRCAFQPWKGKQSFSSRNFKWSKFFVKWYKNLQKWTRDSRISLRRITYIVTSSYIHRHNTIRTWVLPHAIRPLSCFTDRFCMRSLLMCIPSYLQVWLRKSNIVYYRCIWYKIKRLLPSTSVEILNAHRNSHQLNIPSF
jgi:hypothetical protein